MRALPMPAAVHKTPDMESAFEFLDQCSIIITDYRNAGCPRFPDSEKFVERLMAVGVTYKEAVVQLAITLDNFEEAA